MDHVDPPEAKKLRVDHGETKAKKKTCPLKSKAKPPERAKPFGLISWLRECEVGPNEGYAGGDVLCCRPTDAE